MRLSRFTIFIDEFPGTGTHLAFNTRTQAQVVIDQRLRDVLEDLAGNEYDSDTTTALTRLQNMGLVVADGEDEDRTIEAWFAEIAQDKSVMRATVLTTYDCNFACPYCVEQGVKAPVYMSRETAAGVVDDIKARTEKNRPRRLLLNFYGGEPLMNLVAIRIVAGGLKDYCEKAAIDYSAGMSTNGALLTAKVVDELCRYGVRSVKVTLDGMRDVHNRSRPFRNGKGSFDTIIENVRSAIDKVSVDVGGNFDEHNIDSLVELLEYLRDLGLASKIRRVRFKPISKTFKDREAKVTNADLGCVYFEQAVMQNMLRLRKAILERGFTTDPGVGMNLCGIMMNESFYTIDPLGKLYQCEALVGREQFSVGDIASDRGEFQPLNLWRRCIGCEYVPLCGDGCIHAALVRFGDHTD